MTVNFSEMTELRVVIELLILSLQFEMRCILNPFIYTKLISIYVLSSLFFNPFKITLLQNHCLTFDELRKIRLKFILRKTLRGIFSELKKLQMVFLSRKVL